MGRVTVRKHACDQVTMEAGGVPGSVAAERGEVFHNDCAALPKTHRAPRTEQGSHTIRYHGGATDSDETTTFCPTTDSAAVPAPASFTQYDLRSEGWANACSELPIRGHSSPGGPHCSPSALSTNVDLRSNGLFSKLASGTSNLLVHGHACSGLISGGQCCTRISTPPGTCDSQFDSNMSSAHTLASRDPDTTIPKTVTTGDTSSCRPPTNGNTTVEISTGRVMTADAQNRTEQGKIILQEESPGQIQDVFSSMTLNQSEAALHFQECGRRG